MVPEKEICTPPWKIIRNISKEKSASNATVSKGEYEAKLYFLELRKVEGEWGVGNSKQNILCRRRLDIFQDKTISISELFRSLLCYF